LCAGPGANLADELDGDDEEDEEDAEDSPTSRRRGRRGAANGGGGGSLSPLAGPESAQIGGSPSARPGYHWQASKDSVLSLRDELAAVASPRAEVEGEAEGGRRSFLLVNMPSPLLSCII